jgi:hypothetical protein
LARYREGVALFGGWKCRTDIATYTDSDWAGCKESRRSTSGGTLTYLGSLMKSWSSTQATIALSSAEAELHAVIRGATESLGFQSLLRDFGILDVRITLFTDATAAAAIVKRKGLGRLRHLDVRDLWIQEKVAAKAIKVERVRGDSNPADPLTKFVSGRQAFGVLRSVSFLQPSFAPTHAGVDGAAPPHVGVDGATTSTSLEDFDEGEAYTWEAWLDQVSEHFNICIENATCFKGGYMSPNTISNFRPGVPDEVITSSSGKCSENVFLDPSIEVDMLPGPVNSAEDFTGPEVPLPILAGSIFDRIESFDPFSPPRVRPLAIRWADMCEESDARFASDLSFCRTLPSDIHEVYCRRGGVGY